MSQFKIYNASAGSGKTYQIAYLFEKKILSSPSPFDFQEMMAITFTNKAVQEMKNRILEDLRFFTKDNPHKSADKREKLAADLNLSIVEIQKRSKQVLRQIYNNYAGYQVTTIDSLTHRIIRTFAKDLEFNAGFDIEMEVDEIFEEAVETIIEEVKEQPEIKKVISEYIDHQAEEGKSWNIKSKLIELARVLIDENHSQAVAQISTFSTSDFLALKKELIQNNQKIKEQITQQADQFFRMIDDNALESKNFTRESLPKFFNRKKEGNMYLASPLPKFITEIESQDQYKKSEKPEVKAKMDELKPDIVQLVQQVVSLNLDHLLNDKIVSQLSQLALLQVIYNHTENIKKSRNCLFINDFNKRINEEIKKQPAPFIYERLGEKFNDFFIDEFQDTSHLQWENLTPLVDNALSRLKDGKAGTLTLVGDVKQSIYAWRGGDPDIFLRLINGGSPFPISADKKELDNNFRSNKDIVDFNNDLFSYLSKNQPYNEVTNIYSSVQQIPQKAKRGFIEIDFQHDKESLPYPEMVLNKIRFIFKEESNNPNFKRSDICVLVRSNKESKAIAERLEEENIAVITATDLLIHKETRVQIIYYLLCVFYEAENEEDKLSILENYQDTKAGTELELADFKRMVKLKANDFIMAFNQAFSTNIEPEKIFRYSVYQQVEYLINELGLNEGFNIYLNSFLEEVFNYSENENTDTKGFLNYWEKYKEKRSVSTSTLDDSINLMTIHKSKGLEFPYVIIPAVDGKLDDINRKKYWQEIPHVASEIPFSLVTQPSDILLEHPASRDHIQSLQLKSVLENMNLLYVSCTRASKALFLLSEKVKKSNSNQLLMNRLLFDFVNYQDYASPEEYVFQTGTWPSVQSKSTDETNELSFPISIRTNISQLENRMVLNSDQHEEYALEKGRLLHELMAYIYTYSDFQKGIDQLENKMHLSDQLKNEVKSSAAHIIHDSDLSGYFSKEWTVYNEQDICYHQEVIRPDRLCIKDDQAVLIDYKTGTERPEDYKQVELYAEAVKEMGYQIFGKFLVYINGEVAIKNV